MSDSEDLVAHMRPVLSAERDLRDLALIWQMIESSAAIGCPDEAGQILSTLTETRRRFDELQGRLIEQMVRENRAELGDDLSARAQCAIDILVRNLYERTADVGFLATDDVVRAFCAAPPEQRAAERAAMLRRLAEYQAKYSVYDDVLLVSPQGELLARLDATSTIAGTRDRIVADALASRSYVERFAATDLSADGAPALLYAHMILSAAGSPLGVLVLRFRFADETRRIFESIVDDPYRVVLTLVDEERRVVATSDEAHIPTGAKLPPLHNAQVELTSFAGREYMAICCASQGYQGYKGPRWRAIAMVSLLTAFRQRAQGESVDVPLDNPALNAVQGEAEAINRELRRVLWNGSVLADAEQAASVADSAAARTDRARLKAVLREVSVTGQRTRTRVNRAIEDIYRVSISRARHQARELARLAADVMDRNLYERANDCRWWALSPVLQRVLAEAPNAANGRELASVLGTINGLYTVYSQLVAFDRSGVIRAVSVVDEVNEWVGQAAPAAWLQKLQSLGTSQDYAVTPFEPTALHAQGDTYVYLAAVRGSGGTPGGHGGTGIVGGIAIVFNAARELGAMLHDIIGERSGFAAFVDAGGKVLAASNPALARGAVIGFAGDDAVVEHEGSHYACARVRAPGYREFKTSDGYDNGVSAVIGLRLGDAERRRASLSDFDLSAATGRGRDKMVEMAVFQLGAARYAMPAEAVMMAVGPQALVRTPSVRGATLGLVEVPTPAGPRLVSVVCGRALLGIESQARVSSHERDGVVLVLRPPAGSLRSPIGLRVDDVLTVLEVPAGSVHEAPRGLDRGVDRTAGWVSSLIDCEASGPDGRSKVMLQVLSPERLLAGLGVDGAAAATPQPATQIAVPALN